MQRFAIVASGASCKPCTPFTFPEGVKVIAVNGGIHLTVKAPHYFFTLDLSRDNIRRCRQQRKGTNYYVAHPLSKARVIQNVCYLTRIEGSGHGRFKTQGGLCPNPNAIHTGNSAWGALQFACHLVQGAARVALFGVDGSGNYAYGGRPRDLSMMPDLFASAVDELKARNIEVINGSLESIVDCFPRVTPQEALKWLKE